MARPLKVFGARIGFYDTVVAVASKAAALRAWDTRQDLFLEGAAHPVEEEDAVAAARANPGVVLRRPAGSTAAFALEPDAPAAPEGGGAKAKARPKPDRSKLDAAEKALARLKAELAEQTQRLDAEQARLDADRRAQQSAASEQLAAAQAALERARAAYDAKA